MELLDELKAADKNCVFEETKHFRHLGLCRRYHIKIAKDSFSDLPFKIKCVIILTQNLR